MSKPSLAKSLGQNLSSKITLSIILTALYMGSYVVAQRCALYQPKLVQRLPLDEVIPFAPSLAWIYLSILFLNPIGPWLTDSREQLWGYTIGILVQILVAYLAFTLYPTAHLRPALDCNGCLLQLFRATLNPLNAMPALHASLSIFSGGWAAQMLTRHGWSRSARSCWIWAILIIYATLAVKEHVVLDVVVGAVLGIVALTVSFWSINFPGIFSRAQNS